MVDDTVLYRPVGLRELERIAQAGFRAFPPRLPQQPIFYPVLHRAYAVEIARGWNTRDAASGFAGFVTRFALDAAFAARYPVQRVGAARHAELWVPAEQLTELNRHIRGLIAIEEAFTGPEFRGELDPATQLPRALRPPEHWSVWRQDEHGNTVEVHGALTEDEARALLAELEARAHKQTYWLRPA